MRIGILGGTFDPPHAGHLALARAALDQLELEEVLFLPANRNPLKSQSSVSAPKHRLAMVQRLIKNEPKMAVSDVEITRGGVTYTIDTLQELQMVQPADYWFILGADALRGIGEWKSPQKLLKLCRLAVAIRPPMTEHDLQARIAPEFRDRVDTVRMSPMDVSSTDIRDRLARNLSVAGLVTPEVLNYIKENKLYRY